MVPVHGALVGRPRDHVRITTHKPAWGDFIAEDGDGVDVPAFTVEQIMDHCGIAGIDLLKVDIEGGEKEVFANGHFISQPATRSREKILASRWKSVALARERHRPCVIL